MTFTWAGKAIMLLFSVFYLQSKAFNRFLKTKLCREDTALLDHQGIIQNVEKLQAFAFLTISQSLPKLPENKANVCASSIGTSITEMEPSKSSTKMIKYFSFLCIDLTSLNFTPITRRCSQSTSVKIKANTLTSTSLGKQDRSWTNWTGKIIPFQHLETTSIETHVIIYYCQWFRSLNLIWFSYLVGSMGPFMIN